IELAPHFPLWSRGQKNRVQKNVGRNDNKRSREKRARNVLLRFSNFTDDVARCGPARIGIHDVDKGDRERAAKDRRRIAGLRQKSDVLFWFHEKSSRDERTNQEQFHDRPEVLKRTANLQISKMKSRYCPNNNK